MKRFEYLLNNNFREILTPHKKEEVVKDILDNNKSFLHVLGAVESYRETMYHSTIQIIEDSLCAAFMKTTKEWLIEQASSEEVINNILEAPTFINSEMEYDTGYNIFCSVETVPPLVLYINPLLDFEPSGEEINPLEITFATLKYRLSQIK
jgi:hypothetical protein